MKNLLQIMLPMSILLVSCWGWGGGGGNSGPRDFRVGDVVKKPIHSKQGSISVKSTWNSEALGKIYFQSPYLFINEVGQGIHVINNSDPTDPKYVKFIYIPFNVDLAMKGNHMFVNHIMDLVTLELKQDTVLEKQRLINTFSSRVVNDAYPHDYRGYFICPDPENGPVKFWKDTTLRKEPDCRIF